MQISGLKIRAVNTPLIKPYTISLLGEVTTTRSVIVEAFTDQGLVGIGETDPELMFIGESQQTGMTMLALHLGSTVLGIDPLDLKELHVRMNGVCVGNHLHPCTAWSLPIPDPALRKAAVKIEGEVASAVDPPSGCYFHPRCLRCMDICRKEYPTWTTITEERGVACHLINP